MNISFLDKTVSFGTPDMPRDGFDVVITDSEPVTRAKVIKILESCNRMAVLSPHPELAFRNFAAQFRPAAAAGCAVFNPQGDVLMIFRRKRWDLPKGHIETGESAADCALRETAEETGLANARLGYHICDTHHAYILDGQWELKCTSWFTASCPDPATPAPQLEEDIEQAAWTPKNMLAERLSDSYPTIREVFARISEKD
ncbi:MAG: NUDIX domain-containing protein [Alistipes sp.]|nr:NUDIX domain-containing protein [Alistipes sp.]